LSLFVVNVHQLELQQQAFAANLQFCSLFVYLPSYLGQKTAK